MNVSASFNVYQVVYIIVILRTAGQQYNDLVLQICTRMSLLIEKIRNFLTFYQSLGE